MSHRSLCVLVVVVALAFASFALSACGSDAPRPTMSWETQGTPTSYVVVCDVTRSTLRERDEYVDGLSRVLEGLTSGDHVIVMSAEDSSVQNSELWVEETLPHLSFSPSPRPETDNQLLLDAWQQEQEERYQQAGAEFAATHDLAGWRDETLAGVNDRILGRLADGSDLTGALYLAGQLLGGSSGADTRRLVLFTDGLIQTRQTNWRDGEVTSRDVKGLVKQQRSAGALPDLHGVIVTLIGARADDEKQLPGLRSAWSEYVAACGGDLDPRFFMSHLSETLYTGWMQQPSGQDGG